MRDDLSFCRRSFINLSFYSFDPVAYFLPIYILDIAYINNYYYMSASRAQQPAAQTCQQNWLPMAIDHDNNDSFSHSLIRQFDKRRSRLHAEMEQLGVSRFHTSLEYLCLNISHTHAFHSSFLSIDTVFAFNRIQSAVIVFMIAVV